MSNSKPKFDSSFWIILGFTALKLLIHLISNTAFTYGIFRDEFYYLACANHPATGYVDHPPLSIWILNIHRLIFGDSLFALRMLPAIFGAITVLIAGLIVRELKGGKVAHVMTGITLCVAPILLAITNFYSMNSLDILLWTLGAWVLLQLIKTHEPKWWILTGLIIGLGLLNKISMGWFAIGFAVAVFMTDLRKDLKTPWPYMAALIAILCFLPFVIWNIRNDFAHLEFMHNASKYKYAGMHPGILLSQQFLLMTPLGFVLWLLGALGGFLKKELKSIRPVTMIGLTALLILIINWHSKPEYLSPTIPLMIAGGAIVAERLFHKWINVVIIVLTGLGLFLTPLAIPLMPVEKFIDYNQKLGIMPANTESKQLTELPQHFADMFGWENMAREVSEAYLALPDSVKKNILIFTNNYGEAGALEYYQDQYRLPEVICMHNNYWIWSWTHQDNPFDYMLILGGRIEDHLDNFDSVETLKTIRCRYCMPYESNLGLFLCKNFRDGFKELWKQEKHFM